MATGDLKNNLMKLLREIRRMKLNLEPDVQGLSVGSPSSFLSLLHAAVMHYSLPLANWFTHHGYDLYGRSDLRFLQELYRVLHDVFQYHPKLTKEQFLSAGYAERKVLMTRDILLFCQAKHAELTAHTTSNVYATKRKWRASTSSKAGGIHGNTTASTKSWPVADVLTIQEREGIGSVWAESNKDCKVDEPSSPPPNMTPPPLLRCLPGCGSELDVTPPPPPKQQPRRISSSPPLRSSTPPLLSSSPPLVPYSPEKPATSPVAITTRVIRHDSNQPPSPVTVAEASSDKEEMNGSSSSGEGGSWASLPQQREENERRNLDGGKQQEVPEAVGSRVEQLTKMVENLTAKFVLLENHLKLATQMQDERHGPADDGDAVEREKEREEGGRKVPLRDITREMMLKQGHASAVKQPQSAAGSPQKQPLSVKQVKESTREAAFSQREATPLSLVSTPEPSSEGMPLSSVREDYLHQRYTSHHSLKLDFATPSTPEDTKRLIQSLRARAKETKDFLQLANSRLIDLS